jgi:hypothetical protein
MSRVPLRGLSLSLTLLLAACGGSGGGGNPDAGPGGGGDGGGGAADAGNDGVDSDGDGLSDEREAELGTDPNNPDTDGDGILDGDELLLGTDPLVPDAACAESSAEATLTKQPVDVILAIDTSGSMGGEIDQVQARINDDLVAVLDGAGLDYRVILLGDYPTSTQNAQGTGANNSNKLSICISTPLGGAACSCTAGKNCVDGNGQPLTGPPAMTDRFKHYDVLVDSRDGLQRLINDFAAADEQGNPGWGSYLRSGSQKVIVMITDDDDSRNPDSFTFADFDVPFLALSPEHFGSTAARNYVFHGILGLKENNPATAAWLPTDPLQTTLCTEVGSNKAVRAGVVHQKVAVGSGGLRFPLCNNANFDVIFNQIAADVVEGAALTCSFTPQPPSNGSLDFDRMVVYYTEGGTTVPAKLVQVANAAACTAGGFYVEAGVVTLCPATCDAVQADPAGQLAVHVACSVGPIE